MSNKLFSQLDSGSVLITDVARQADFFRLSYANWHRQNGRSAWPSPKIFSWSDWLKQTGEDLFWASHSSTQGVRSLISPLQEQMVWEQVIGSQAQSSLLHIPTIASTAKSAWHLMQSWRLPDPRLAKFPTDDVEAFSTWAESYFLRCKGASWVDHARLPDTLKSAIKNDKLKLPGNIILAGFVEFSPQQLELITTIESKGVAVDFYCPEEFDTEITAKAYLSEKEELYAIANWCRDLLTKKPLTSIGIVIPNLERSKPEIEYIFRKVLYPNSLSSKTEFINTAYQISGGEGLGQSKIANMAMNLLELMGGSFSLDTISQILRNPFCFGGRSEIFERMKLDAWLRKQGVLDFTLASLINLLKVYDRKRVDSSKRTLFEISIMTLKTFSGFGKNSHMPSSWAKHFLTYLEKFGWPSSDLGLKEQREAKAMRSCLTDFTTLDFVHSEMNFKQALSVLRKIFMNKRLQGNQIFAPIQIMDFKEGHALNFEYLWLAQLGNGVLPETRKINPLIPFSWQKKRNLSYSTPELCLSDARKRLQHLKNAAHEIYFSLVNSEGKESNLNIGLLSELNFEMQEPMPTIYVDQNNSQWIEETHAAAYTNKSTVGTSLFKYQAECPFKAFAKLRLFPGKIEINTFGLTALERGSLLHESLEEIWKKIGSSETLKIAFENEHFELQLWEVVDNVLSKFEKKIYYQLSKRLKAIEQSRLVKLTLAWLKLESRRENFIVNCTEKEILLEVNGLTVKGYVDRIDQLDNLGFAIIDYKSGVQSSNSWFGDRPDEPQMPIYALAERNKVVAIVYANLKPGKFSFNGISKFNDSFPNIKAYDDLTNYQRREMSWSELMPYWREQLNALAQDFKNGLAVPDPSKGKQTCNYCELQSLCRTHANPDRLIK